MNRLDRLAKLAHSTWGTDEQLFKVFEELGELAQAINKYRNGKLSIGELESEIADNYIMLRQLVLMYDLEDTIDTTIDVKLDKLEVALNRYV